MKTTLEYISIINNDITIVLVYGMTRQIYGQTIYKKEMYKICVRFKQYSWVIFHCEL